MELMSVRPTLKRKGNLPLSHLPMTGPLSIVKSAKSNMLTDPACLSHILSHTQSLGLSVCCGMIREQNRAYLIAKN